MTVSWDAVAVFLALSAVTPCAGHSVGMYRLLIHRSFRCPLWLEQGLVYLGVRVGMAGPVGMMRQHEFATGLSASPTATPISDTAVISGATTCGNANATSRSTGRLRS